MAQPKTFVDRTTERANVPCGACTLCCRVWIVQLAQEEYQNYDWVWVEKDGVKIMRALRRKPNGDCVYLGERGCTIHDRAPHVCQTFDCRKLFMKYDRNGRRAEISSGRLPKAIFAKGREILERK